MGLLTLTGDTPGGNIAMQNDEAQATWASGQGTLSGDRLDSGGSSAPIFQLNDNSLSNLANMRADAGNGTAFPYGDLTHVSNRILMERHQPITALRHFPINREMGWNKYFELYSMSDSGEAKIVCCSNDFPRVSLNGCTWKTGRVVIGTGYRICYDLLKSQQVSKRNINYEANLMRIALRALREKANRLAYSGSIANNVLGICNNPYIPTLIAPETITAATNPRTTLAIFTEAACQQYVRSGGASYLPDALLLPPSLLRLMMKTLMSNTGDSPASVLQQIQLFAPNIEYISEAPELETAGPNGERVAFFYRRNRDSIEWHYPVTVEILPYYFNGYEWEVNMVSVVSSVWPYYPQDCLKIIGI